MQEKKNKRLLIILLVLVAATAAYYFSSGTQDHMDVDRDIFSFQHPENIDQVVFELPNDTINLQYSGQWQVNAQFKADPQRVKVLFAILKQVRVRRPISKQRKDSVLQAIQEKGTKVSFFSKGTEVHSLQVLGNERNGITYFKQPDTNEIYLVEIPGYRSYLGGIFTVDTNGWRDPLVFNLNWGNLQSVHFIYPQKANDSFDVLFKDGFYQVKQLQHTDTTRLFDLLDNVSRLYVNDYLSSKEVKQQSIQDTTGTVIVKDVGENNYTLEIYGENEDKNAFVVRIDSSDFALLDRNKVRQILKPRKFMAQGKK